MDKDQILSRRQQSHATLRSTLEMVGAARTALAFDQGLAQLCQLSEADDGFFAPHYHLACAYANRSPLKAFYEFLETIQRDPLVGGDVDMAHFAYGFLAQSHEKMGQLEEALLYYDRFLGLYPLSRQAAAIATHISYWIECQPNWFELYADGCKAQADKRHARAVTLLRQAIEAYPGLTASFVHYSMSLRAMKRWPEAVRVLDEACRLDKFSRSFVELGMLHEAMQNPSLAEASYRSALDRNPRDPMALAQLGFVLYQGGDRYGAEPYLRRAVELDSDGPWAERVFKLIDDMPAEATMTLEFPARYVEDVEWSTWHDDEEGVTLQHPTWTKVTAARLTTFSDRADAKLFSVTLQWHGLPPTTDPQQFIRQVEAGAGRGLAPLADQRHMTTVAQLPAFVTAWHDVAGGRGVMLALVFRGEGVLEVGVSCAWSVFAPAFRIYHSMLMSMQIVSQHDLLEQRQARFSARLEANSKDREAAEGLATALMGLGDYGEAKKIYRKLMLVHGRSVAALVGSGMCSWKQGQLDAAIRSFENAVELAADASTLQMLGLLYQQQGTLERAINVYSKALEHDAGNGMLVRSLAHAQQATGNLPAAEASYRQALELDPLDARAWYLLGSLQRQMGRQSDAVASLQKSVELDPEADVDMYLMVGITCLKAAMYDEGEKMLREVLRLDRDNQAARDALGEIAYLRRQAQ